MEVECQPKDYARLTRAHLMPMAVFMGFTLLLQLAVSWIGWDHPAAPWWRRNPAHWIYPVQTLVVFWVLVRYWKSYDFRWSWKWSAVAVVAGVVGISFWLLPSVVYDQWKPEGETAGWLKLLGVCERKSGYNPNDFQHPLAWWFAVVFRFLRAVVVVALAEEILWRAFLMRFVCDWDGDFWEQPFGRATWLSYLAVTLCFMVAHAPVDYAAAFVYGSLTWGLCVWSRNLGACVVMHATANLILCAYIMATGRYGLW
jgi:CAAX prenyl protease-like protein